MARPVTVSDPVLLKALTDVFRDVGYEGASLAMLSDATGLKKASLYHRFPKGKEEMAGEVMRSVEVWLAERVLTPLRSKGPPEARVQAMIRDLDEFYSGGRQDCLLNMMSPPRGESGPFARPIKNAFKAWIEALAAVVADAGFDAETARLRAERAIAQLQGSLVLSRGMGTAAPFRRCLAHLERELLGSAESEGGSGRSTLG